MLKNFVAETTNAPGTAASVTLLGALSGRQTFKGAGFISGEATFYFMEDGAQAEWGFGAPTFGSPDAYSRTTPKGNTSGTTARLNFGGITRIYNEVPAEFLPYLNPNTGALALEARAIGAATWGGTSTGTGSAYAVSMSPAPTAYAGGLEVRFRAHATSAANPTLNLGKGAKALIRPNSQGVKGVQAGEIVAGQIVSAIYDPTTDTFVLTSAPPAGRGYGVGDLVFFGDATLPPGCVWPDGRNVSRTTYDLLFAKWGTTHGAGDGSTTFGLPDLRGRVIIGRDNMGGTPAGRVTSGVSGIAGTTLGASGGDQRLHAHNHGVNDPGHGHSIYDPGHGHTVSDRINAGAMESNVNGTNPGGSDTTRDVSWGGSNVSVVGNGTGISIQTAGAGGSQNMPPGIIWNVAIYAGVP